jgi:putative toxin-antitoxin system antitoxin component (TIGR02293 family)
LALDVWQNADDVRHFLFRGHPMIEDKPPTDVVIQSEFRAEIVLTILGGLKYGSAA